MNDGHGNGASPNLNGRPYYSADNGFACAAAGRGVTEALQEHLNVIVRNEELEIERSHSQIQEDINGLVEDKERLEQQKLDRQDSIKELAEELSEKEVKLSELTVELEAPINADSPPPAPRIDTLKSEIDEKTLALEEKQIARVEIETNLEAPTEAELKPPSVDNAPVSRFSTLEKSFAGLTAFVLVGLVVYLFIFYGSVGDRTFTEGIGTNLEKQYIIIPHALSKAWESSPKNWFVITFPFIFLTLAILFYFFDEYSENKYSKWLLLGATLLIDTVIAVKISQQMHRFTEGENSEYLWKDNWIEILSVLLLGFGVSLLLGYGLSWVIKVWNGGKQPQGESEQLERLKRAEQNDRLVELASLTTEIQHLQNRIDDLKQEKEIYETSLEATSTQKQEALIEDHKHPIQVEIARLNTKKENLQSQINELNEQVDSIQQEINQCEAEIKGKADRQHERVIDVKKLEAQANEFVTGWCRYVTQSKAELPADVATQIRDIQHLANETLEAYKASLATV